MYLASLTLGRLTHKLLACITGSGEALGVLSHLKPHVKFTGILLIIFDTRVNKNRGPCLFPTVVFLIRIPSLPGLFQCHLNLGRRWGKRPLRPGDRGVSLPSSLAPAGPGQAL